METWERDIHDVPGVVADDKVAVSLKILGLQVHLSTGVVVVTFELLVHRRQEMLHRDIHTIQKNSGGNGLNSQRNERVKYVKAKNLRGKRVKSNREMKGF